jgi:hypothetical protein
MRAIIRVITRFKRFSPTSQNSKKFQFWFWTKPSRNSLALKSTYCRRCNQLSRATSFIPIATFKAKLLPFFKIHMSRVRIFVWQTDTRRILHFVTHIIQGWRDVLISSTGLCVIRATTKLMYSQVIAFQHTNKLFIPLLHVAHRYLVG